MLEALIDKAESMDASDLHLEAGLPAVFLIRGELKTLGELVAAQYIVRLRARP